MTEDLATAMRRAMRSVRALNPRQATAIIQSTLANRPDGTPSARTTANPLPEHHPDLVDFEAEDIEVDDRDRHARDAAASESLGQRMTGRLSRRLTRPLGDVVRLLRDGKLAAGLSGLPVRTAFPGRRVEPPEFPQGALFDWHSFACAAGSRDYRLYVPTCAPDAIRGLVVMLHGCKQDPDDFAAGTDMNASAETHRLLVAYPRQVAGANVSACWNWFDPAHQHRDAGEPAVIAGITQDVVSSFHVARDRVFVAGLSAGGAMAAVMAATYPDLYAAAGVHSGLAYRSANDVMSAFAAMRGGRQDCTPQNSGARAAPRLIVFHGTADRTVTPDNATSIVEAARAAHRPDQTVTRHLKDAGGRTCTVSRFETAGCTMLELWMIDGAGHAWSGGRPVGTYADPMGPDASAEMVRFFLDGS